MKTELIVLVVVVVAALVWMLGCSVRLHCQGVNERFNASGTDAQEMCINGCYQLYQQNVKNDHSFRQCGLMCAKGCSAKAEWPTPEECIADCASQYAQAVNKAMERCKGQPDSCLLNSPEWKARDACYKSCV